MKKLLLLFPDYSFPQHVIDFALQVAHSHGATLHGVFVNSLKPPNIEGYSFPHDLSSLYTDFTNEADEQKYERLENSLIAIFEKTCTEQSIPFQIMKIHERHLDNLTDSSEFADIIIMDEQIDPSTFSIRSFLGNARCPVVMVPSSFKKIEIVIFAYDDHFPGMYAIKMFSYLFYAYKTLPARFISVVPNNIVGIEYKEEITTWLNNHYPDVKIEILKRDVKEVLPAYIDKHANSIVVMGAYGRSSLSLLFKESMANVVIQKTKAVLFIAHS